MNQPETKARRQPRPVASSDLPPPPLARATMTFTHPWDSSPVTVQIVILTDGRSDDDETATREDCPELTEGGWINHMVGGLDVFIRVVT